MSQVHQVADFDDVFRSALEAQQLLEYVSSEVCGQQGT
jgi:hypothetical protein